MKNKLITGLLFLVMLGITIISASALKVDNVKFESWDGLFGIDRHATLTLDITNDGQNIEYGIIELALKNKDNTNLFSIVTAQGTCDPAYFYNVNRGYWLSPGEKVSMELKAVDIPDGNYYPVITHANGCYLLMTQSYTDKQPFGSELPINRIPGIVLKSSNNVKGTPVLSSSASPMIISYGSTTSNAQCVNDADALRYAKGKEPRCQVAKCVNGLSNCLATGDCASAQIKQVTCSNGKTITIATCSSTLTWQDTGATCESVGAATTTTVKQNNSGGTSKIPYSQIFLIVIGAGIIIASLTSKKSGLIQISGFIVGGVLIAVAVFALV